MQLTLGRLALRRDPGHVAVEDQNDVGLCHERVSRDRDASVGFVVTAHGHI